MKKHAKQLLRVAKTNILESKIDHFETQKNEKSMEIQLKSHNLGETKNSIYKIKKLKTRSKIQRKNQTKGEKHFLPAKKDSSIISCIGRDQSPLQFNAAL